MNAVLIISVLLLALIAFVFSRRPRKLSSEDRPDYFAPPHARGLFSEPNSIGTKAGLTSAEANHQAATQRAALMARAAAGDQTSLTEAHASGDKVLYGEVLDTLVEQASENDESLRALASHIAQQGELRANVKLASALIEIWQRSPNKRLLIEMLHVAALADNGVIYQRATEAALQVWRDGRVPQVTAQELYALIENQYWMLASEVKRSGAGFVLKRMLVSVRRELAAAAQRVSAE